MTEQKIQTDIIKYLKSQNIYHFKSVVANKSGVLDICACVNGMFFAIEVKTEIGVVSSLQQYNIIEIAKSKGFSVVARSVDDVIEMVDYIRETYGLKQIN